jgi:hypothetical protein
MAKQKKVIAKPEADNTTDCVNCHYANRCDVMEPNINKAKLGCPRFKYSNS